MQSALYFPIVRGRQGEIQALAHLSPLARARAAPVVDLPKIDSDRAHSLDEYVAAFAAGLARAWGSKFPIYVDLARYGPEQIDSRGRHIVEHLFECTRQLNLKAIPVSGTRSERGPEPTYLEAVARIALRDERGAALRISHADFSSQHSLERELAAGLASLSLPPEQIDLFLDAESIALMPAQSGSGEELFATLLQAMDACQQHRFRNVVFVGSSVPENLPASKDEKPRSFTRTELRVWKRYMSRLNAPLVRFGDTGVWNPRQPDAGGGGGGPPPARVRIPLGDTQVFYRGGSSAYREVCRQAFRHPGVRDLPRCWGLDAIRDAGRGAAGAANATGWVARDTNVHIEITVRQVEDYLRQRKRLDDIVLASVLPDPWQQETFIESLEQDS